MFPGTTTKLSELTVASTTVIDQKADLLLVTGTESISTINPNFGGGFSGICVLVPVDGNVDLLTTGNIALAVTAPVSRATVLVYSKLEQAWFPGAIS